MTKAYVIIMGWGEYSNRGTKPVRVYMNRQKAEGTMAKLEDIAKRHPIRTPPLWMYSSELIEKFGPLAKAEYAALGFEASVSNDWELAEAEFDAAV